MNVNIFFKSFLSRKNFSHKNPPHFFSILLISFFLTACSGGGGGSGSSKATMCYVNDGSYLTLNCYPNGSGTCEEDGKTSFATYKNWDTCSDDMDAVLSQWANDGYPYAPSPGPNSIEAGGDGGDGGGTLNCDVADVWSGSPDDVQVYTLCQSACYYGGSSTSEGASTCNVISGSYGSGALNDCSVC